MNLILDQGVPRDAARLLREFGHDCKHVGELGMSEAADKDILAFAFQQKATVVTLDADFHSILSVSGADGPSVIRIRLEGIRAERMMELIASALESYGSDLENGALISVKAYKTTCHRLPIGRLG